MQSFPPICLLSSGVDEKIKMSDQIVNFVHHLISSDMGKLEKALAFCDNQIQVIWMLLHLWTARKQGRRQVRVVKR